MKIIATTLALAALLFAAPLAAQSDAKAPANATAATIQAVFISSAPDWVRSDPPSRAEIWRQG